MHSMERELRNLRNELASRNFNHNEDKSDGVNSPENENAPPPNKKAKLTEVGIPDRPLSSGSKSGTEAEIETDKSWSSIYIHTLLSPIFQNRKHTNPHISESKNIKIEYIHVDPDLERKILDLLKASAALSEDLNFNFPMWHPWSDRY